MISTSAPLTVALSRCGLAALPPGPTNWPTQRFTLSSTEPPAPIAVRRPAVSSPWAGGIANSTSTMRLAGSFLVQLAGAVSSSFPSPMVKGLPSAAWLSAAGPRTKAVSSKPALTSERRMTNSRWREDDWVGSAGSRSPHFRGGGRQSKVPGVTCGLRGAAHPHHDEGQYGNENDTQNAETHQNADGHRVRIA